MTILLAPTHAQCCAWPAAVDSATNPNTHDLSVQI